MTESLDHSNWGQSWPEVVVTHDTKTALRDLDDYYRVDGNQLPRYTGSRFEAMAGMNADPNTLGPEDFLAVSMLSVNVSAKAAIRLLDHDAHLIRQLLEQIPDDLDIVDAEPEVLGSSSPAGELWNVLRRGRDGLGPTTTSKLLAAKRPRLLPIWDSFVQEATGMSTVNYWSKFRFALTENERSLWTWLSELRSLATNVPDSVFELRILDVLLWKSVKSGVRSA